MRKIALALSFVALLGGCDGAPESTAASGAASGAGGSTGSGSGGGSSSSAEATSTASTGSGCTYEPVANPGGCPTAYSHALSGMPCSMPGLECWYPGAGDGLADGCKATALLKCTAELSDGGAVWIAAQ